MSLYALNSMDEGIRGIHSPRQITIKHLEPSYDPAHPRKKSAMVDRVVAVIEVTENGAVAITVPDDVLVLRGNPEGRRWGA